MIKSKSISLLLLSCATLTLLGGCTDDGGSSSQYVPEQYEITVKTLTKAEYRNKTLAGLLGHFAGFLSGYEFVKEGSSPKVGLPTSWFDFINGPYAGNYTYYWPGSYAQGNNKYDRLKNTGLHGESEVASDDDYHLDIFNQTVLKEYGFSSKAITDAWKDYRVCDWGGGADAMALINACDMLAPYTGTIEAGNRYGWCTEAYIENETLGMNAPGMPRLANNLTDTFASNVGYFDSVIWAKFYATMYSLAYFERDVRTIMEQAKEVLPLGSSPRAFYDAAIENYELFPTDYKSAAENVADFRRPLYRIDNIQTDPNVNGGFAVLSWLYGNNDYMDSCMYSSLMGYDGDCTAATVTGLLGIIKGWNPANEEYQKINSLIYHDGEGTYYNDSVTTFPPYIANIEEYGEHIKIDDIIQLYVDNFEALLVENGGSIEEDVYKIPTHAVKPSASLYFENFDGEKRDMTNWGAENGMLTNIEDSFLENGHSGYAYFQLTNYDKGAAYHEFKDLEVGSYYRVNAYVKTSEDTSVYLFAGDQKISFCNVTDINGKSMIFKATSKKMKVGFRFTEYAIEGDQLFFDDFQVEKIEYHEYSNNGNSATEYSKKATKAINKPLDVEAGKEVILRVEIAQGVGSSQRLSVYRNNTKFGTVLVSNTGLFEGEGTVVDIPYVFQNNTDYVKLEINATFRLGAISIVEKTNFMFR